jgi:hypothetical protein
MADNPLFKKLRILPDQEILVLNTPQGYIESWVNFHLVRSWILRPRAPMH